MKEAQKGFSLVELLLVIIIIAVLAAVAIPNLLSSRRTANEASAISSLRTIHSAESAYQIAFGNGSDYAVLTSLAAAGLIDGALGTADTSTKSGYVFNVTITTPNFYCGTATAAVQASTGDRSFAVSQSGLLYAAPDGAITCDPGAGVIGGGGVPIQ